MFCLKIDPTDKFQILFSNSFSNVLSACLPAFSHSNFLEDGLQFYVLDSSHPKPNALHYTQRVLHKIEETEKKNSKLTW